MALDTVESITKNVKLNTDEFQVVSALGSFIVNQPFQKGFKDYQNGIHTHESFIYEVLSAVSEDIGSTIYDNVKRYVDYVSNVDICKVRSLKSMLQLFQFKNTVLDCIKYLPLEIVNLLDVLSIDKKRLLKAGFLKPEFLAKVAEDGQTLTFNDLSIDLNESFKLGSLSLSANCNCFDPLNSTGEEATAFKKLCTTYKELSYAATSRFVEQLSQDPELYSRITSVNDLVVEPFDSSKNEQLSSARIYINDYRYRIIRSKVNTVVYDERFNPLVVFDSYTVASLSSNGFSDVDVISSLVSDMENTPGAEFYKKNILSNLVNQGAEFQITYKNLVFNEDPARINDDAFENVLVEIFKTLLLGFLKLKYNFETSYNGHIHTYYIYPNLGSQYYSKNLTNLAEVQSYAKGSFEYRIDQLKRLNHIQKSFNEKKIVDLIEVGDDQLGNYSGAELQVLFVEIERRDASVDINSIKGLTTSEISQYPDKVMQTRGTYYRVQKVLEYANFIDNYFAQAIQSGNIYSYDPNYYELDPNQEINHVINQEASYSSGNPNTDIDQGMVLEVAKSLAKLSIYISKIREKIKLQTRKNYMKGTNLLLIYIINEWLIDYARHNKDKFLSDSAISADFYQIFESLSSHQFSNNPAQYTIDINENYDETEYFNIQTRTSEKALCSADVNERYWEKTSVEQPNILQGDGLQYKIGELEKFYLSTLNLGNKLREVGSSMQDFLSTIYDLGANDSFMYEVPGKELSIFSSTLSTGEIASDLFDRLDRLSSNWKLFSALVNEDEYSWPDTAVSNQISNVLETKLFADLSAKYLADVSSVYDEHYPALESLSSSMIQLSSDYNTFISSDYSFYFKKFQNCKYCYQDFDIDNDIYACPYYIGNPAYDDEDMNLYEHLYQLDRYSTSENIKNWSLLCTLTYVYDEVSRLSSELGNIVNSRKFVEDYGFVDINALTLDEELKYVYDFLNDNIKTRKEFLMSQLESLRSQATNCKTSYENLNNTFTNAVANYNDGEDGYTLGSSHVIAVSLTQDSSEAWERTENKPKKDKYTWIYCKYVDRWYYNSGEGKYGIKDNIVTTRYVSTDPLETRINALEEYMSKPTAYSGSTTYYYGLENEGIRAICENTKAGIVDLETQFKSVVSLANSLFGTTTSFSSADLYKNILQLNDELVSIDETFLDKDLNIKSYKEYLKAIISLSSEYIPVKQSFDGIFIDTELQSYLYNFIAVNDLTFENLDNLIRYRKKTDESNLEKIKEETQSMLKESFPALVKRKTDLEEAIAEDYPKIKFTSGNQLELHLQQILDTLLESIIYNTEKANAIIDINKLKILSYVDAISDEISSDLGKYDESIVYYVENKLSALNFFEHPIYKKYQKLMLTYGGKEFCYDPYYNIKNQTHPSYQVHPYLWNVIKKIPGQTLLDAGFKSTIVDDLEEHNFEANSKKYFGKYGETINTWRATPNGLVDWSGYVSRYEKSSNQTASGIVSEVVDYDGIFYPPAVKQFLSDRTKSINSVFNSKTSAKLVSDVAKSLDGKDLASLFEINSELSTITKQHILDSIRTDLSRYMNPATIDAKLNSTFVKTNISEVTFSKIIEVVRDSVPTTFYEKYYSHLQLPEEEFKRIGKQLEEYGNWIADIATSKNAKLDYDIYKYGLDSSGNSYILLKQYDYTGLISRDKLTFKQKQNTLGELWIRLANHPIAFPAFTGKNPAYYTKQKSYINPSIIHLAELESNSIEYEDLKKKTTIVQIRSRLKVFYDFEITQNQANIFLISYNAELGSGLDPFHTQFQFSWVIPNVVNYYYDRNSNIQYLTFMNTASASSSSTTSYATTVERLDFSKNPSYRSKYSTQFEDEVNPDGTLKDFMWTLSLNQLQEGLRFPCLVGYYVYDSSAIDFVYVNKRFQRDSKKSEVRSWIDDQPQFFVIRLKNGITDTKTPSNGWYYVNLGNRIPTSGNACVGFDLESMQMTLAFTTRASLPAPTLSNLVEVETSENAVDFCDNTEGSVIEDPLAVEFNSHDVLTENITLVDYTRTGGNLYRKGIVHDHNLNADISYIPSYPGYPHENHLYSSYPQSSYYNVELLGVSRDLDYQAQLVNPNPNPYLDYEKIAEESQFGRVYEDYLKDYDKTYKLLSNPSLNNNMVQYSGNSIDLAFLGNDLDGRNLGYQMTIHLDTLFYNIQYNENDYKNLQVLIYNQKTLGKNPYAISPLTAFLDKKELDYNLVDENTEDAEYHFNLKTPNSNEVKVTGTRTIVGTASKFDSNYIENIKKIECQFSQQYKCLNFYFYIEDTSKVSFVPEGIFKVLLYNPSDLTQFKYYHLLDAYGAVNCRYLPSAEDPDIPDNGRGWGVFFDRTVHDSNDISALLESYYIDDYGTKVKLKNVELSNFNALSDVFCLRGNKQLGFKYDEELHFAISSDLYYFPSLNISYPKTIANYVFGNEVFSRSDGGDLGILKRIFTKNNLFILNLDDPIEIAEKIGKVDIPILINDTDDVRAFEDWLSSDSQGIENYKKYDIGDPRAFQFVKFHNSSNDAIASQITVSDSYVSNKSVEEFLNACETQYNASPLKSEDGSTVDSKVARANDFITIDFTKDSVSKESMVKMLRVYANYKKEEDSSVTLYFNYFNWFDSPYIKIEDNLLYVDTIEGTYLKLKSGEDGILDIIIQARFYSGGQIYGYRNIKVLSYHIYNISDDKPKFFIQKTFEIQKNSLTDEMQKGTAYIQIPDVLIDLDQVSTPSILTVDIPVDVTPTKMLSSVFKMTVLYPKNILDYDKSVTPIGYSMNTSDDSSGVLEMTVNQTLLGTYSLRFKTHYKSDYLGTHFKNSSFSLALDEIDICDLSGNPCDINIDYGRITVKKETIDVLGGRSSSSAVADGAIMADPILSTLILVG